METVKKLKTSGDTSICTDISEHVLEEECLDVRTMDRCSEDVDFVDESEESCSESNSSSKIDSDMEVQVEFEARPIVEGDYHGIRRLLQQLFLKAKIDLSALTDLIIAQAPLLGSTIKVSVEEEDEMAEQADRGKEDEMAEQAEEEGEEGSEVYGVISVINLTQSSICAEQLKKYLISKCTSEGSPCLQQFSALLQDPESTTALLINERFLNIPVDIVPLLVRSLLKEWSMCSTSVSACDYVVVIARSHTILTAAAGQKRKASPTNWLKDQHVFDYHEDEFFIQEALMSFSYPVGMESDQVFGGKWSCDDDALKPFRTVMVLPCSKLVSAVAALEEDLLVCASGQ